MGIPQIVALFVLLGCVALLLWRKEDDVSFYSYRGYKVYCLRDFQGKITGSFVLRSEERDDHFTLKTSFTLPIEHLVFLIEDAVDERML